MNNQAPNLKEQISSNKQNTNSKHVYDLESRTTEFAKAVIRLCKRLPLNTINRELVGQLIRSSGSVGANYREANDSLGKKDFGYRIKISRKEAKESCHWLELLKESEPGLNNDIQMLIEEATQLKKILSAIAQKSL